MVRIEKANYFSETKSLDMFAKTDIKWGKASKTFKKRLIFYNQFWKCVMVLNCHLLIHSHTLSSKRLELPVRLNPSSSSAILRLVGLSRWPKNPMIEGGSLRSALTRPDRTKTHTWLYGWSACPRTLYSNYFGPSMPVRGGLSAYFWFFKGLLIIFTEDTYVFRGLDRFDRYRNTLYCACVF